MTKSTTGKYVRRSIRIPPSFFDGVNDKPDMPNVDEAMADIEPDENEDEDDDFEVDGMEVGEVGELEGYDELRDGEDDDDEDMPNIFNEDTNDSEDGTTTSGAPRKTQNAFFHRTIKFAERAANRSTYEEENSFLLLDEPKERIEKPSSRVPGTFGRRNRGKGDTLAAYSKKVTADLDSDDELMMAMRFDGHTDQQIADRLADEGRVRYDRKSISTRIMRIKAKQADRTDEMLDGGYLEWEVNDDKRLMKAVELANIEVSYEIEKARGKRWFKVSEHMRKLNPTANAFSADACSARHTSLMDGTAVPPSMEDDDPDARKLELENNRLAFLAKQEAERKAKEDEGLLNKQVAAQAKIRQAKKSEEVAARRRETAKLKAQRAMERAAKQQLKAEKAQQNELNKIARNARLQEEAAAKAKKQAEKAEKAKAVAVAAAAASAALASPKRSRGKKTGALTTSTTAVPSTKSTQKLFSPDDVATPDPRVTLSLADLQGLCAKRGRFDVEGKSKLALTGMLQFEDKNIEYSALFKKARAMGVPKESNRHSKPWVLHQMWLKEAQSCASYVAGTGAGGARQGADAEDGGAGGEEVEE